MKDEIESVLRETRQCYLSPYAFFVSWNGVLTLAYKGFPPQLETLKSQISLKFPLLRSENPGSLWPKTTLAALHDNVRLTPEQLEQLTNICKYLIIVLLRYVVVDCLSIVLYQTRSLENLISCKNYNLIRPLDPSLPSQDQVDYINNVLKQANEANYWFHVSKDGNRKSHYVDTAMGATLVQNLNGFQRYPSLQLLYTRFKEEVENKLPGLYHWFSEGSLHITIRGILN